jgi:hypothetical protein
MPFEPDPLDPARRAQLLDRLRAEVPRRRARRRAVTSLAAAAVVVVAIGFATLPGAGDRRDDVAIGGEGPPEPKSTLAAVPTTPVTTIPETTTVLVPPTTPTTPTTTVAVTSPAAGCAMSFDPACGPLVYDPPPPANQPITITATADPAPPYSQGQTVHLTFTIDDPDAAIPADCVHVVAHHTITTLAAFPGCDAMPSCAAPPQRYGTWSPPAPTAGHVVVSYDVQLVHEQNSSVLVQVTVQSGAPCSFEADDLYGSTADQTFEYSWD